MKRVIVLLFVCLAANARAARFLFDADHAESSDNADWDIDAGLFVVTNTTGTVTNYLGPGAAVNFPSRYYGYASCRSDDHT